ncbi:nitrile hydratase accessory protein [Sulfitobacter sp. D35]|uniref:nitrile hydratase accessory protein n=1 Tax=Sulfitobacter sp. D35 TaxID=3083252 RepID=UPI00296E8B37|nr:nitrile hydratase accessory protein [Sulfitobacter sp. D35]MDW4499616.1 nitrile hydratase accessory protein [Sulfitobacter sp. D35]
MGKLPGARGVTRPEPAFEEPWHAQLFALTVHLNESGLFTWADWAERFGVTLARHGMARELNGGDDYFLAWLETLEGLLGGQGIADAARLAKLKEGWRSAYLRTPHGAPVRLQG